MTSFNVLSSHLPAKKIAKLKSIAAARTKHITVVLEDLYQSQNLSAIIRTAECFGIQNIHTIHQKHFPKIDDAIAKGAAAWISQYYYHNALSCVDFLKEQNYKIVATTLSDSAIFLNQLPLEQPCAIFFGTERQGLSKTIIDQADYHIKIRMFGFTESYNVSVSVGIVLYDIMMRLHQSSIDWQLSEEEQVQLLIQWIRSLIPGSEQIENQPR